MSDAPVENKGAEDSLQSLQSLNINDVGETSTDPENHKNDKQKSESCFCFFSIDGDISVDILLKPTGNAPIMKKKKWTVDGDKPISWIAEFMKRYMKLEPQEKLVCVKVQLFAA